MKAESLRSGRRGKRSDRERSERKSRAGGEKGPKLEQEAMLINNLADPRAPDTECIKVLLGHCAPSLTGGACEMVLEAANSRQEPKKARIR